MNNGLDELFNELSKEPKFLYHYKRIKLFYDLLVKRMREGKSETDVIREYKELKRLE